MKENIRGIKIPEGCFCSGNCSTCVYFEPRKTDSNGRGWCNWYSTHYYPSERQGCLSHERR